MFVVWNLLSCSCCCLIFCVSFQVIPSLFLYVVDLQVILYLCRLQLGWNAWCWHLVFFLCQLPLDSAGAVSESPSYIWMCKQLVDMHSTNRLCYTFFWDIYTIHCFHVNFLVCDFICLPFCKILQSLTFTEASEQLLCASFLSATVAGYKYFTSKREMVSMEWYLSSSSS